MNKITFSFAIIMLALLPISKVLAQANSCAIVDTTRIYYIGETWNSLMQARMGANLLESAYRGSLESAYPTERFEFALSYNFNSAIFNGLVTAVQAKLDEIADPATDQFSAAQYVSLYMTSSKFEDNVPASAVPLEATISQYLATSMSATIDTAIVESNTQGYQTDLIEGRRVLLIAHGQGNLLANAAMTALVGTYPQNIGMIGVGSPATTTVSSALYFTSGDDSVIEALRQLPGGGAILAANIDELTSTGSSSSSSSSSSSNGMTGDRPDFTSRYAIASSTQTSGNSQVTIEPQIGFTFDTDVGDSFTQDDLIVLGGSVMDLSASGTGAMRTWSATVTPGTSVWIYENGVCSAAGVGNGLLVVATADSSGDPTVSDNPPPAGTVTMSPSPCTGSGGSAGSGAPAATVTARDSSNHQFWRSYFASGLASRQAIDDGVMTYMTSLQYATAVLGTSGVLGSGPITVTLTWGTQPDVDLHVFEPNGGDHVYFRNDRGMSGFLDYDDTNQFGPEHYFVACGDLVEGDYVVAVDYYAGSSAETARVQIATGDGNIRNFRKLLVDITGSTVDTPYEIAVITVSTDANGRYVYSVRPGTGMPHQPAVGGGGFGNAVKSGY